MTLALPLLSPAAAGAGSALASPAVAGLEYEVAVEGQALRLAAEVGGGQGPFSYQWYKDGAAVAGATRAQFEIAEVRFSDAGLYAVVVFNDWGSAASLPVMVAVSASRASRLANVSIIATASEPILVGFTLEGGSPADSNRMLARAAGPALVQLGVTGTLPDPVLELAGPEGVVASNDNWGGGSVLATTAAAVGAFSFPVGGRDAALIADLPPGGYTARVSDAGGVSGTTAVELYETAGVADVPVTRLVNLSARAPTGSDAVPFTLGFTIEGHDPVRMLMRGVGPGLARFGVVNPLPNPRLKLFRRSVPVASNDDWSETRAGEIAGAAGAVGAFALSGGSRDAALLVTLAPGSYTLQLTGEPASSGLALMEMYVVP